MKFFWEENGHCTNHRTANSTPAGLELQEHCCQWPHGWHDPSKWQQCSWHVFKGTKKKRSKQVSRFLNFALSWLEKQKKPGNQIKWKCLEFQVCGLELPEATAWHGLYARVWIRGCEEAECLSCWWVSGLGEERPANEDHAGGQGSIFHVFHAQQTLTASILMDPAGTERFDISLWS